MFRKRNRKPRRGRKLLFVLLLQFCIAGAILFSYSFSTQFTVLSLILSKELDIPIGSMSVEPIDYERLSDSWASLYNDSESSSGSGGGSGLILGESGAAGMLINKMQGGMYKELLEIIRDHCNWTYMNPNVEKMHSNEGEYYPSIATIMGFHLCEAAPRSNFMVQTTLDPDAYNPSDGKHSLYDFNTSVALEDGLSSIASNYMDKSNLYYAGTAYRTHLNFRYNLASVYPAGTVDHSSSAAWPSLLNGYGIEEGRVRTKAETDATYFPDQMAIAIGVSLGSIEEGTQFSMDYLDPLALEAALYLIYNYGPAGASYGPPLGMNTFGASRKFSFDNWNTEVQGDVKRVVSEGLNESLEPLQALLDAFLESPDTLTDGVWDNMSPGIISTADYEGMAYVATKLTADVFTTPEFKEPMLARIRRNEAAMVRGGTIAYRALTGDYTASMEEVKEFMYDIDVQEIPDTYGYYMSELRMEPNNSASLQFDYYWYGDNASYYNNDGVGPMPLLHYGGFRLRGAYASVIGGVYLYMYALRAAGVECTFADAYLDSKGLLVMEAPDTSAPEGSTGGGGSSATVKDPTTGGTITVDNTSLAAAAVSYAWPDFYSSKGNNGTALYQHVKDIIFPGDVYYRSCDRGVATAVRWAGYDDSYPAGGTSVQQPYLVSSAKWKEIDWGYNFSNLKPGDILIYVNPKTLGGHTLLYAGHQIVTELRGDTERECVEASLTDGANNPFSVNNRSPGLAYADPAWIGDLSRYRVFRNIQTESKSAYVNIPIDLE